MSGNDTFQQVFAHYGGGTCIVVSNQVHIAFLANKISKSIGIIRKASFFLNKQSLRILYFSMIYPYPQYCNLVWSSTYQTIMSRLQTLQKLIIRVINKSHFLALTNPIFKSLYLLKLEDIRKLQISQFMFSIRNNLTPIGFQDMFTLNSQIHRYNTRTSKSFHLLRIRTKLRQFSIKYQGPMIFNSLDSDIKEAYTYSSFSKKLKSHLISKY